MSVRANPTWIGLFMIGALAVTVAGVAMLASNRWFEDRSTFMSYFSESVNGLEGGAPVKFQGVPVGTVTELLIQIDEGDKTFQVPVRYEVDLTRLTTGLGTFIDLEDPLVLRQQIADGLRAQLQMESFVTGQLYIELTYRDDDDAPDLEAGPTAFPEIPTTPSLLAAFGTDAGSLMGEVLRVLFRVNEMLEEVDLVAINESVVASAQAVERFAASPELLAAIEDFPLVTERVNRSMAEVQALAARLGSAVDPLQAQMEEAMHELTQTLEAAQATLEESRGILSPDTGLGYQMEQALSSLRDAGDALRVLALTLERNPDMLIRGPVPPPER